MSLIYVLDLSNFERKDILNELKCLVSEVCRKKAEKFYFEADAQRTIGGELLVRYHILKNMNIANEKIEFSYSEYGKPYIKNAKDLNFNISHSGDYIICGWSKNEIGIDIEKIRSIDLEIANKQFSYPEYKYIISDKELAYERFIKIWTLKESYTKYLGKGLMIPFNSFGISIDNANNCQLNTSLEHSKVYLKLCEYLEGYIVSECSEDDSKIIIREINLDTIIDELLRNKKLLILNYSRHNSSNCYNPA